MNSTGNDIVALKAINVARTRQANFYSKIITDTEKSLYDKALFSALPFEHFVWLAWSVKESVYKFLQRGQSDLVFSPSRIILSELLIPSQKDQYSLPGKKEARNFTDQAYSGVVRSNDRLFFFRSIIADEFIFSVANDRDNFSQVWWGIKEIELSDPDSQSASVREFVLEKLNDLSLSENIRIGQSKHGYPVILKNNTEIDLPVSLAHHENYIAYSFIYSQ